MRYFGSRETVVRRLFAKLEAGTQPPVNGFDQIIFECSMGKQKKQRISATTDKPLNTPFSGLEALRSQVPQGPPEATPPVGPTAAVPEQSAELSERIVIHHERKGRRGKSVTVISNLPPDRMPELARQLRKSLGCGATVEGDQLVLQGEQGLRAECWLLDNGARQVVRGNF